MPDPRSALFEELASLVTEGFLPESRDLDTLDTRSILQVIHEQDLRVAPAVGACLPEIAKVVEAVTRGFREGGRLLYLGAGTSGRLGVLDAAECPPTFGTDPSEVVAVIAGGAESVFRAKEGAEDDAEAGRRAIDEQGVSAKDCVVGVAASRRTPFVQAGLARAREVGAFTALVTCNPGKTRVEEDEGAADVVVAPVVGPEVVAGSTRMKAGSAQKMVLNMITTAAMVRRGKTLGNLMVDLRPGSAKLVERGRRIVMKAAGVEYARAVALLDAAGGRVKTALVMGVRSVDAAEADRLLRASDGFVRRALERPRESP
ncbi:MAG: N-acetylmuramic acid 6-phosphate etherase [bacterium]